MRLRSALLTMCSNRAGRDPSLTTSLPSASVSFLGQPAAMRCASKGSMRDKSSDLVRPRVSSGCRGDLTTPGGLPLDQICITQGVIPHSLCRAVSTCGIGSCNTEVQHLICSISRDCRVVGQPLLEQSVSHNCCRWQDNYKRNGTMPLGKVYISSSKWCSHQLVRGSCALSLPCSSTYF